VGSHNVVVVVARCIIVVIVIILARRCQKTRRRRRLPGRQRPQSPMTMMRWNRRRHRTRRRKERSIQRRYLRLEAEPFLLRSRSSKSRARSSSPSSASFFLSFVVVVFFSRFKARRGEHVCVHRFSSFPFVMSREVKTPGILIECWSRRAIEKRRRQRRRRRRTIVVVVVSTALESVWKITWSVFLTRGGRDIAEMEKQRGARDARGSEFSNDFDDNDGCCCCSSSSSCFSSSSIFVRSLCCARHRTHLFSPKRTVSRVRDDAFLSFCLSLSFYKQRVFVRREVRVFARAGRGRRKKRSTGAASGTRGDDKILDVYYYKWY
jgi:hypothetical protein